MNAEHKPSDGLINGVLPAVLSPLRADLSPDHARHIKHCNWLLANGCDGLAIHGTTGEANSFSVGERVATLGSARCRWHRRWSDYRRHGVLRAAR